MNELIESLNNAITELHDIVNDIDNLRSNGHSISDEQCESLLKIAESFEGEAGELKEMAEYMSQK